MKIDLSPYRTAPDAGSRRVLALLSVVAVLALAVVVAPWARPAPLGHVADALLVEAGHQPCVPSLAEGCADRGGREMLTGAARNWIGGLRTRLPVISIDVKFANMETLRAQRAAALAAGVLVQDSSSFVPGSIRMGGRTVRVKLRLKGDWTDHLENDRWAFRVEVRDDDHLTGVRRFSLHHPAGRGYQLEPVFNAALRRYGILAPRYDFVRVILNGERLGVMAMEEHFAKELLENQGRREGVILKFDESRHWLPLSRGEGVNPLDDFTRADLVPFQAARVQRTPELSRQRDLALGLYLGVLYEGLPPHQVFDAASNGMYIALGHAFGSWHALRWHNRRFYFNPVTALFEPIGFDADIRDPDLETARGEAFDQVLLSDPLIRRAYEEALERIVGDWDQGGLRAELRAVERAELQRLHARFPLVFPTALERVPVRAATALQRSREGQRAPVFIWDRVDARDVPPSYTGIELLGLSTLMTGGGLALEIRNLTDSSVEILALEGAPPLAPEGATADSPPCPSTAAFPVPLTLTHTARGAPPARVMYAFGDGGLHCSFRATVRRAGFNRTVDVTSGRTVSPLDAHPHAGAPLSSTLDEHPFLRLDGAAGEIHVSVGDWTVSSTVVVPAGVRLVMGAGTRLRFEEGASLVVRGGMDLGGTEAQPIVLEGARTAATWPGVLALNRDAETSWSHVRVEGTSGVAVGGWAAGAGVVFYGGSVELEDVAFEGNRAEDALNLVAAEFELRGVTIRDAVSDGLDVDFGRGTISGGSYEDVGWIGGGDAIDVSGAVVSVSDVRFSRVGDKALSVGEGAVVRASDLVVDGAGAAVVSKDRSWTGLDGAQIRGVWNTALMAYTKKAEFGGAVLEATNVVFEATVRTAQVQTGSMLTLDGELVRPVPINVDSLYLTVMRPGLRN